MVQGNQCLAKSMQTSLIVCSRNRPQLLEESIESILQGTAVPTELIVVDQSDSPNPALATLQTERDCEIRYLWVESIGLSRANNLGIAAARYDLLVFTHDDVLVAPEWFETLVTALCKAGAESIVTGQVLPTASEIPGGFQLALNKGTSTAVYTGRIGKDVLYPLNMAMYRSIVESIGGFDERLGPGTPYPGAEDSDFGFRLLEAGYRIIFIPEATLYHRAWRPLRSYLSLRWGYGVARGAFYAKHLSLRDHYILSRMLQDLKKHTFITTRRIRGERLRAYGDIVLTLGIVFGSLRWLLTQTKIR